jgi:hypothetical protein
MCSHSSAERFICAKNRDQERSACPHRAAATSQETFPGMYLEEPNELRRTFWDTAGSRLINDLLLCVILGPGLECSSRRLIRRIHWTWTLEGDLILKHVLVRIHHLNLRIVNTIFPH